MADGESSSTPYYCITQARCRLCQFSLADGEPVFAAMGNDRVSCKFPFQRHETFHDEELGAKFHMCLRSECGDRTKPTVCFHDHCYHFRLYSVTPEFLAATHYAFMPPASEERRRAVYIQQALARNLQRMAGWPRKLPHELYLMVAQHLVPDCATLTAEEQVHGCDKIGDSILDLTQPVYALYVRVDGQYYVKSLQNIADKAVCVLVHPGRARRRDGGEEESEDMFVAEDHLGVRQVVFVSSKRRDEWCRSCPVVPGIWWRHIFLKPIPATVTIKSDGLKMRDVESTQKEPPCHPPRVGWRVPVPSPPPIIDLLTPARPRECSDGLRMCFFDCNAPNIAGYSVATDGASVLAILSHKRNEKVDVNFYENDGAGSCFWIYMPINHGEYLSDICRRTGYLGNCPQVVGLTFSTTQGRTVLFGLYSHENIHVHRIATLLPGPCRVYFNQLDSFAGRHSVEVVAFQQCGLRPAITSPDIPPGPPVSISAPPQTQYNELWLHSSCSLQHVTKVHPCVEKTKPHRPVIGMLLFYTDGHRESVGQFRLDWVADPIILGEVDKLYICGKRTKKCWAYVAAVTTCVPAGREVRHGGALERRLSSRWLDVARTGTLEWWFSSRHSVLFYGDARLN